MLKAVPNSLLSILYPQECRVCTAAAADIDYGVACRDCWAKTCIFQGTEMLCGKCGSYFGDEAAPNPVYCHKCDDHFYDKASAVGIYENALAACVINLKSSPNLPKRLGLVIVDAVKGGVFQTPDLLIPIPLSKQRRLERGFNQAEIIAGAVSASCGVPVDSFSLVRKLHTPIHRIGMDDKARDLTVRNAFDIVRPKLITGKNILLVDDVMTSGATASNCAKILKKHGASQVNVFTLARAVMR